MLMNSGFGFLVLLLLVNASAADRCNCDDEGSLWNIETILEFQRVSDFLIAVAYFSIPVELLYFVSCSNVPFKWVLFQFIAFIVLCGMTHLLNGWTYVHHPFQLMLALTVFKILTALVSCATAITLITLIPLLLKVKVREIMLRKKASDLGREVGIILKQKEAGMHVRMLTQEIRKSLDRHTILYTTLVELSKTLGLRNCAVWMPNEEKTEMNLTHELRSRRNYLGPHNLAISTNDPDVIKIKGSDEVNILEPGSALAVVSGADAKKSGLVAAIRMPMLRVSNFKGGTPELIQACYAILVLILPSEPARSWTDHEIEIVKVVADQVAVALSHAAVLEESQLMREKLEEQNRALQQAKRNAMMASRARNSFQKVMNDGLRRPTHTISGLLSMMIQDENFNHEQKMIVDAMLRTSNVLSTLINDVMDIQARDNGRFPLDMKPFRLHAMVKEAACLANCLCIYKGFGFSIDVERSLPDCVMGDERRVFQVILHMIGNLLTDSNQGRVVTLRISPESSSQGRSDQNWATWRVNSSDEDAYIKFEVSISNVPSHLESSASKAQLGGRRYDSEGVEEGLSFSICKRLVQLMQGKIWVVPNPQGFAQSMTVLLRFQCLHRSSLSMSITEPGESSSDSEYIESRSPLFRGTKILLADNDDLNRAVTLKLLEKLGCKVSSASSGFGCLSSLGHGESSSFQVIFLDLHMPDLDGFEVAARIRKVGSANRPAMVALTTSGDEDVWDRCLQAGFNGVLRKPIGLQGISFELRRVLQGNKASR